MIPDFEAPLYHSWKDRQYEAFAGLIGEVALQHERTQNSTHTADQISQRDIQQAGVSEREEGLRETLQYEQKHLNDPKFTVKLNRGV